MKTVTVRFNTSSYEYSFLYDGTAKLSSGDKVVVDNDPGATVATVSGVYEGASKKATKFVICRVPMEEHTQRLKREIEKTNLRLALNQKIKEFQTDQVIEMLCAADPEAACIRAKLKELEQ